MVSKKKEAKKNNTLRKFKNCRKEFVGTITRFGGTPSGLKTILLHDIEMRNPNIRVNDHIWIKLEGKHKKINHIRPGDTISFHATVRGYERDYDGRDKSCKQSFGLFDADEFIKLAGVYD